MVSNTWNRRAYILAGQRLYSSAPLAFWLAGKPTTAKLEKPASLAPGDTSQLWLARVDLARLGAAEDIAESDRYMSVTERLRRVVEIAAHFSAIRDGSIVPLRIARPRGVEFMMDSDGPTAIRRAWARAIWASMPANDSDIFFRTAKTESPKNAHLADRLAMLLVWARMRVPFALNATNWMQADNDNYFEGEEPAPQPAANLERRMRPGASDAELLSFIKKAGPTTERRHAKLGGGGDIDIRAVDVDYQRLTGETGRCSDIIIRAGILRIANGETVLGGSRIEKGSILYQAERFGEMLGPEPVTADKVRSASYWSSLFKVDRNTVVEADEDGNEKLRFVKAGKMRRKVLLTEEDRRALLAGPLPPTTYCPDGLPLGSEDIGAQFVGNWISNPKGKQPPERWQDISDEFARQQEFERWTDALSPVEREALQLSSTAANFSEIGKKFGKQGKSAERFGKRIVAAANDNLKKVIAA
jgi:hypothetical protein